jgi:hypothetical protein
MGLELPLLESRQITPPTPEQVWALIGAEKELGGLGYALAYAGAFTGVRRNEARGLRFNFPGRAARKPAPVMRSRWPMRRFATKRTPVLAIR